MSKKQQEHTEHYHYTKYIDSDSESEPSENSTSGNKISDSSNEDLVKSTNIKRLCISESDSESELSEQSNPKYTMLEELIEMKNTLQKCGDINKIKQFIKNEMASEVNQIINDFHKQFDDVEEEDDLKIEILILLAELGITIYKPQKKD
jgi:hypothetical protein